MKTRFPLLLAGSAVAAALAVALVTPSPVRAETAAAEKVAAFEEYLKTKPDSQGLRNQIAELSLLKSKEVIGPLMKIIKDPKMDEDVKVAALQAVGKQGDKTIAPQLLALVDSKPWEEKFKLMAAGIEGAGDADAAGQYKEIIKLAKKYMDINGDVACAAFRAASLNVTRDTVDDFVKELGRADYVTTKDSAAKKAARGAAKPVISEALKKMTGQNIDDVKVWTDWWNKAEKTWVPPGSGKEKPKDLNASLIYTNEAPPFEISKLNKAWTFRAGNGNGHVLTIEASEDGQRAAWVEVFVQGTKNMKSKTPEAVSKEIRETLEAKFRDLKEAEWERKCMYAGIKGVEQILKGQHKDFDAVHMHNVFLEDGGVMFSLMGTFKSGKKASLETDLEEILKSFKLKK